MDASIIEVAKDEAITYYAAHGGDHGTPLEGNGLVHLDEMRAFQTWHKVSLPLDLFERLVVVASPEALIEHAGGQQLVLPMACALLHWPEWKEWGAPWIREQSNEFRAGKPFPGKMVLRERAAGSEPMNGSLYIQHGNHRAVAYAMAIIQGAEYNPVSAYVGSGFDRNRAPETPFREAYQPATNHDEWKRSFGAAGSYTGARARLGKVKIMSRLDVQRLPRVCQGHHLWCIPASLENALRYLAPGFQLTQKDIRGALNEPDNKQGFDTYKNALEADSRFAGFRFEHWERPKPDDPQERRRKIETAISDDCPALISLPSGRGWHIGVCVECSDEGVTVWDPSAGFLRHRWHEMDAQIQGSEGGGDLLIVRRSEQLLRL